MKVTYIYHSGFVVECETCTLIFDYYTGELPSFNPELPVYFFASHKHADHFSMSIFKLWNAYEKVTYVMSTDIKCNEKYLTRHGISPEVKEHMIHVGKNQTVLIDDLTVETLKSTDAGVAFFVTVEGKTLYHAGDLNWWYWEKESKDWNNHMEKQFKEEMQKVNGRQITAAFLPLDPRLQKGYAKGFTWFCDHVDVNYIFPMHMWEDYEVVDRFLEEYGETSYANRIMKVKPQMKPVDIY